MAKGMAKRSEGQIFGGKIEMADKRSLVNAQLVPSVFVFVRLTVCAKNMVTASIHVYDDIWNLQRWCGHRPKTMSQVNE